MIKSVQHHGKASSFATLTGQKRVMFVIKTLEFWRAMLSANILEILQRSPLRSYILRIKVETLMGTDSHVTRLQYGENYNWQQRLQCPVTWRTLQRKAELLRRCYLVVAKSKLYTIYKYVPKFLHLSISPNLSILLYEHVSLRLPSTVARVKQRLVCWYVFMYQPPMSRALNHW